MILGGKRGREDNGGGEKGEWGCHGNCSLKHTAGPHGNQRIEFAIEIHTQRHPCSQTHTHR